MSLFHKFAVLALPMLALAACDTTSTPSYQTSPQNTISLQPYASAGKRAAVASVNIAPGVEANPTCRLMGPLDVGGGLSVGEAMTRALQAELLAGNVYAANGTPLNVTLTELRVDSFAGFWQIGGTVATPKIPQGFPVRTQFSFSTSFSAYAACNNSAMAFNRALAEFINDIVTNPNFQQAL